MDGLAMCEKCSSANGWDQLRPTCGSGDLTRFPPGMELACPHRDVSRSSSLQPGAAPIGWDSTLPVSSRIYSRLEHMDPAWGGGD